MRSVVFPKIGGLQTWPPTSVFHVEGNAGIYHPVHLFPSWFYVALWLQVVERFHLVLQMHTLHPLNSTQLQYSFYSESPHQFWPVFLHAALQVDSLPQWFSHWHCFPILHILECTIFFIEPTIAENQTASQWRLLLKNCISHIPHPHTHSQEVKWPI